MIDYLYKGEKDDGRISRKDMEDQIILTIFKLKHNPTFEMLTHLCRISKTTAIDYFWKWLNVIYTKLKFLIKMQDRDNIFKLGALLARAQCCCNYKQHCTIKVFNSCKPLEAINFLSKCWGGRASDILIVRESGFCSSKFHMPGDQVRIHPKGRLYCRIWFRTDNYCIHKE